MKQFSQLRPQKVLNEEDLSEDFNRQIPNVLVLKRKSIRSYPDGMTVAIYYSDRLKKYISVPFGNDTTITVEIQV